MYERVDMSTCLPSGKGGVLLRVAFLQFLVLGLAGCSGGKGVEKSEVSGTVKYKGAALPGGTVTFHGVQNATERASASIGEDGHYTVVGPREGEVRIPVEGPPPRSDSPNPKPPVTIPSRYQDPAKSGLKYSVTKGKQEHDIDLTP